MLKSLTTDSLFSSDANFVYHSITALIGLVNLIIIYMVYIITDVRKYFLLMILGGSFGNFFDRIYYYAVPDFIDFHLGNFHWFIFNIADIFICIGVICLIFVELFVKINNKGSPAASTYFKYSPKLTAFLKL